MNLTGVMTYGRDSFSLPETLDKTAETLGYLESGRVDAVIEQMLRAFTDSNDRLTKMCVDETHTGRYEDKARKHILAVRSIRNDAHPFHDPIVTFGHFACGARREPIGMILGLTCADDPALSILYMIYMAVRTRSPLFLSFHPKALQTSIEIARVLKEAAVSSGLPADMISWAPISLENRLKELIRHKAIRTILASGSPRFCARMKESQKPCRIFASQWVPAIVSKTADPELAATKILSSRAGDYGLDHNGIQAVFAENGVYDSLVAFMEKHNARFLNKEESQKILPILNDMAAGVPNKKATGLPPFRLAQAAKIQVSSDCPVLCVTPENIGPEYPLSIPRRMPILAVYRTKDLDHGLELCQKGLSDFPGSACCSLFSCHRAESEYVSSKLTIGHLFVNDTPPEVDSHFLSYTSDLVRLKYISSRPEYTRVFKIPDKIFFNKGSIHELSSFENVQKVLVVTDQDADLILRGWKQEQNTLRYDIFHIDGSICANDRIERGREKMAALRPDMVIAFGNQYTIDIAKGILLKWCFPDKDFDDLSVKYMDVQSFSQKTALSCDKPIFVAIPTFIDSGTETTSFFRSTDQATGIHYPVMGYDLTPDILISDPDIQDKLTCPDLSYQWIHLFVQASEAYMSLLASDFSDAFALQAMRLSFNRSHIQNASLLAGMAFGNAFAGLTRAFGETISESFSIDKSLCDAVIFPFILMYNGVLVPSRISPDYPEDHYNINEKLIRACRCLGLDIPEEKNAKRDRSPLAASILRDAFVNLRSRLAIPGSFREYGLNSREYGAKKAEICQKVFSHGCARSNPRSPSLDELGALYDSFYAVLAK